MSSATTGGVRGRTQRMWRTVKYLTFRPQDFFEERVGKYGLRKEFLFVLAVGIAAFVGWAVAVRTVMGPFQLGDEMDPGAINVMPRDTHFQLWGSAIFESFLTVFVIWIYYTIVIFVLSALFTERGTVFLVAKNVAWSLYPLLFGYLIYSVGLIIAFLSIEELEPELRGSPSRDVEHLLSQGLDSILLVVVTLLLIPFVLWVGHLLQYGIMNARDLDRSTARKVAAVAIAGHLIYLLRETLVLLEIL